MPSILVTPVSPPSSPGGGPVVAGVQLRRPTTRTARYEPEQSERVLASGATRTYYAGRRLIVALAFSKMSEEEKAALVAALGAAYVTYQEDSTADAVTMGISEPPEFDPIPGTYPIRYNVSLALKARDLIP